MQDVTIKDNTVKCMLFPRLVWWILVFFFVMVNELYYVTPNVYKQRFEAACDELRPSFLFFIFFFKIQPTFPNTCTLIPHPKTEL